MLSRNLYNALVSLHAWGFVHTTIFSNDFDMTKGNIRVVIKDF